ncbi:MAG: hypothetical protein AB9915_02675 [Candidatus Dojkabacteria bacterium]
MLRGVLQLSKEELLELGTAIDSLHVKNFQYALESIKEENSIFVSEEDLELILDEVGLVNEDENIILANTVKKMNDQLRQFRGTK